MYFSRLPQQYSGTGSSVMFSLAGCDPDLVTEARIISEGRVLGIKRFRGEASYDIDAACYLGGAIAVAPSLPAPTTFTDASGDRLATFRLTATQYTPEEDAPGPTAIWTDSGEITCTAGAAVCPVHTVLSDLDWWEIATGEVLELAFVAGGTRLVSSCALHLDGGTAYDNAQLICTRDSGMYVFRLRSGFFEEQIGAAVDGSMDITVNIDVSGTANGTVTITCPVEVRNKVEGSVRLCWQNRYGAVDYYTFSPVTAEKLWVGKNRFLPASGREVSGIKTERSVTVRSPYLPAARLKQLAAIAASPRVWIVNGNTATPVDITTSLIETAAEGPGQLLLTCLLPD